ncbi:MAG: hypothetical protein EPO42_00620 [Gallionellaceae bacterium]|nr:MAG: hypothetical protein EPO42_00620 [Gallionellaceae bacterium]
MWKFCICVAVLASASAFAEDSIHIRPQAGFGNLDGDNYRHAGLRLLLNAGGEKKYGLELSRLYTAKADYIAAGTVLEQKKFGWFNLSIGTIGYFGQGGTTPNLPGLIANLGWASQQEAP